MAQYDELLARLDKREYNKQYARVLRNPNKVSAEPFSLSGQAAAAIRALLAELAALKKPTKK
jgi:hypothetical protein